MAKDYALGLPVGGNGIPFYNSPPPVKAVRGTYSENATVSSVITLTADTTAIEITSVGSPVAVRWVGQTDAVGSVVTAAGVGTSNYDHLLTSSARVRLIVPIEVQRSTGAPNASMVGGNIDNGLFQRVAYKTQGIGSVFVTEYGSSNSY